MKKTSFWIILIAVVAVLSAAAALWIHYHSSGVIANVYLDGECIRSIDLNKVKEPEQFTVTGPVGDNIIRVEHGRICVIEADCPDQICVHMSWLTDEGGMPIVCLPNKLIIELADTPATLNGTEIDGVVG